MSVGGHLTGDGSFPSSPLTVFLRRASQRLSGRALCFLRCFTVRALLITDSLAIGSSGRAFLWAVRRAPVAGYTRSVFGVKRDRILSRRTRDSRADAPAVRWEVNIQRNM
jgi:hypothetical protein